MKICVESLHTELLHSLLPSLVLRILGTSFFLEKQDDHCEDNMYSYILELFSLDL